MRAAFVAVAGGLLLAGCLEGPVPASEAPPASAASAYRWGLAGCQYVIAVVAVPRDRLLPLLPEGFQPLPAGASPPGLELGELHADAYSCEVGVALDGAPLQGVQYGSFYVPVEPPAALREEGYGAYFVKLDFLAPDSARTRQLREAGLPAHEGEASASSADGVHWSASLDLTQAGGFRFDGVSGPARAQGAPLPFVEHTPLAGGGLALWHARLHDATFSTGAGTLALEGPMADVVGAAIVQVTFSAGAWNLDEADLAFPVAWPV